MYIYILTLIDTRPKILRWTVFQRYTIQYTKISLVVLALYMPRQIPTIIIRFPFMKKLRCSDVNGT